MHFPYSLLGQMSPMSWELGAMSMQRKRESQVDTPMIQTRGQLELPQATEFPHAGAT